MLHALVDAARRLDDPVAQRLLQSPRPAHVTSRAADGASTHLTLLFHWNSRDLVLCGLADEGPITGIRNGDTATVTIDDPGMPYKALVVTGTVRVDVVEGIAPEYEAAVMRGLGTQAARACLVEARARGASMVRLVVTPERMRVLEFRMHFPGASEQAIGRREQGGGA